MNIAELEIPAYHHRPSSPTNLTLHEAIEINGPIACGDVAVFPGDIMVGDADERYGEMFRKWKKQRFSRAG